MSPSPSRFTQLVAVFSGGAAARDAAARLERSGFANVWLGTVEGDAANAASLHDALREYGLTSERATEIAAALATGSVVLAARGGDVPEAVATLASFGARSIFQS